MNKLKKLDIIDILFKNSKIKNLLIEKTISEDKISFKEIDFEYLESIMSDVIIY